MAGKEYKAKAKTVQKMSRDGLMEEDLRTGRAHKVVTGRVDAIRIGDRPMEPSARNPEEPESSTGRHGMRLDRSGTGGADIPADGSWRGTDSGTRRGFDQEASSSGRKMKRRMTKAGEPSYGETPSSLQENAVDDSSIYADAAKEEAGQIPDGKIRAEEALRHSTYSKSLRQGRGAASFGGQKGIYGLNQEDRSSIFPDDPVGSSRRKRMQQQRYALNQRESTFHEGVEADTASAPDTRNSSLYSGTAQAKIRLQKIRILGASQRSPGVSITSGDIPLEVLRRQPAISEGSVTSLRVSAIWITKPACPQKDPAFVKHPLNWTASTVSERKSVRNGNGNGSIRNSASPVIPPGFRLKMETGW